MIYYFNPGHENAVLNASPYYHPPASLALMQKELSFLAAWYAPRGSEVLIYDEIESSWVDHIRKNLQIDSTPILPKQLREHKGEEVVLWGISRQAIQSFNNWEKELETSLVLPEWNEEYVRLNGRRSGRACLEKLLDNLPQLSKNILPTYYTSLEDIEKAVKDSPQALLAKAPYSSSGRGLLRLPVGELNRSERQILQGMLNKQKELSLEVKLERRIDFAMEFMSDGKGNVEFAGYSLFKTNEKGAYLGNYLDSQANIESILTEYTDLGLLNEVNNLLKNILADSYAPIYEGCIGVDMMIYEDAEGYKLHPCIEVNMRYNMGYLACQFAANYLDEASKGFYYLDFNAEEGDTYAIHQEMQKKYPTTFANGKLAKGYLPLCPVLPNSKYRAYVLVS